MSTIKLLQDKVIIITGSSQGIGAGLALGLARHGAKLVLHYLGDAGSKKDVEGLEKQIREEYGEGRTVTVPGDISDATTSDLVVKTALEAYGGRIDGLVSNAGICPFSDFLELDHRTWERTRAVNLDGAFYITQAVAKHLKHQYISTPAGTPKPKTAIVGISSISALVGGKEQCHYTPTKAGVKSLMESLSLWGGEWGVRCNSVLPGTIQTPINLDDLSNPTKKAQMESRIPLGRLGVPEDLVGPVVFFLSEELGGYVTGASVLVDGGAFVNFQ